MAIPTDAEYREIPAVEVSQWRPGRVLSDGDVAMIERLLAIHDSEMGEQIDIFSAGREQAIRELGGQELVDMCEKGDELAARLAWKRVAIKVAEREAELAKLTQ